MNIRSVFIFLLALISIVYCEAKIKKGRILQISSGIIDDFYGIGIIFRDDTLMYTLELDTTGIGENSLLYNDTTFYFQKAMNKQVLVTIESDSNNNIISFTPHYVTHIEKVLDNPPIQTWLKPTGSNSVYNMGDSVIYGGDFVSLIDSNIWSPREAPNYWENKKGLYGAKPWKKPSGAHDCYNKGAEILFKGDEYESLIDGNIWSPEEYRRGWKYIHQGPAKFLDSTKLVNHTMPEAATFTSPPNYTQPTGVHDAYKRGDLVSLDGITYRSIIDANVWSPAVARSYWEIVSGTRGTAEWKKPTGVHDCYHKGYKITFNGKTYESLMSSNVWSPEELPSSWKVVE